MYATNPFSLKLFHPKYAVTWLGVSLLYLLVQLPYTWQVWLGAFLGKNSRYFIKRRVSIIKRNLELCFPNKSKKEIDDLVTENLKSLGIALFETGIAWFWSDTKVKKLFQVKGMSNYLDAVAKNKGVIIVGVHFMSLELGGRIMGLCFPVNAMYRPHNNKAMEYIQTRGRCRSGKGMIDRKNLRFMVQELKSGKAIWFAPDQDFGRKGTIFAPFFSVKHSSTSKGTSTLAQLSHSPTLTVTLLRNKSGVKYDLILGKEILGYPTTDALLDATTINSVLEAEIRKAPEQYLWAHRRFKTRPEGEASLYL
ncbi:LpxL/LpxP family Kdo(2)-lipid IV(A) lauroyl/palmitoleoyl acyltransferase [Providencia rettgeri]|uniref:Lipid A biosynthesis acyltransferase n=2 Tax=Providencia TaxID=586 RepID=A0AA42FFY4_9GAMM|nr:MULTISPECIES: LpxL/LpxP family Kdo(2)-lipid IV(A) lauroyl/palmitoleoyl acyltransferase [Providencia]MBC8653333.1 LpxL/LpxP family Kdo(2)-lipid IV(A) lauroyl/palmitoleoyl acyltransferase [Providencia vermicola]HCI95975.1 kdo(2)-lipid IV(A) palmitoleoyltransferase [Providencia sp.]EIL1982214.1 LpxL/LpxP family Kdo(2)-lipid IV(A) lauroyl/palmitoleoyl acyltransferase [Providencia rettgeri]EIU7558265.1 LpxL/LpxP family Kdo(2)-lipid IV(A) lauroyl/palmitoleoyl acyltransferase [Providencia rettgeri]